MSTQELSVLASLLAQSVQQGLSDGSDLSGEIDEVTFEVDQGNKTITVKVQVSGPGPCDAHLSTINDLRAKVGLDISRDIAKEWRVANDLLGTKIVLKSTYANCVSTDTLN